MRLMVLFVGHTPSLQHKVAGVYDLDLYFFLPALLGFFWGKKIKHFSKLGMGKVGCGVIPYMRVFCIYSIVTVTTQNSSNSMMLLHLANCSVNVSSYRKPVYFLQFFICNIPSGKYIKLLCWSCSLGK